MKVLIAEDDYVSRLLVKKAVKKMGYDVIEAENGKIALEMYGEHHPEMLISDWMMPQMDGLELCRTIRASKENSSYLYIILLTAKDKMSDLVEVFEAGADDYIIKPFKPDELRSRIKTGERIIHLEADHHRLQKELMEKNNKLDEALKNLQTTQVQMVQSEKMASIGQLAAGVAHEINNPIGFVSSNLDALKDYMQDVGQLLEFYQGVTSDLTAGKVAGLPDEVSEHLEKVKNFEEQIEIDYIREDIFDLLKDCRDGTLRVGQIVGDLKNFAHPGNDKKMLVDLNQGLESTLNVVHNELKYKTTVEKQLGEIPRVEGYPQKLNQVFMNILVNAGQAIEEKGVITIKSRTEDTNAVVEISDTGCGIAPEHLSKIFDPFFTTKDIGKGTGLGMNIAYNIVKEHGGRIEVKSEVGKGTTFCIILPGHD